MIRANRTRKTISKATPTISTSPSPLSSAGATTTNLSAASNVDSDVTAVSGSRQLYAEDAQIGDEFISLTFMESDSDDDSDEDEEEEEEDGDNNTEA